MTGCLYLVALPIGNLEDITLRAIKTLRVVDLIVAEDTRRTRKVVNRYGIKTPFSFSFYNGVEAKRAASLVALIKQGKSLALVSDAGTPLISDPGYPLVRASIEAGIRVVPIPGPTAVITALVASSLPTDRFVFDGMVPRKARQRIDYFEGLRRETRTTVVYESPHRLLDTLRLIARIFPKRRLVLARELTKVHEEFLRGSAGALLQMLSGRESVKGEWVLLIEGSKRPEKERDSRAVRELIALLREENVPNRVAVKLLALCFGLSRNEAYRLIHDA